jgi:alpha-1,6-mannosyltransferase
MIAYPLGVWWLANAVFQHDFAGIIIGFVPLFGLYFYFLKQAWSERALWLAIAIALFARMVLVFSMPLLSDDVYRFVWDGRLLLNGMHPFEWLPSRLAGQGFPVQGLDEDLFKKLNSPDYYTVYPPLSQSIFWFSCLFFPDDLELTVRVMKSVLVLFEAGSIWLIMDVLRRLSLKADRVLIYAMNPLVVMEISGNLHFEGVMIFFFLLSFRWVIMGKTVLAGVSLAASVATKLVSVISLPMFMLMKKEMNKITWLSAFSLSLCLAFLPMLTPTVLANFGDSLQLYFLRFEFNASLYNVLKGFGWLLTGYNLIMIVGPLLGILSAVLIFKIIKRYSLQGMSKLPEGLLLALSVYYFLSTTVHPWYLCLPVLLAVFTPFRFILLWSGTVIISYHRYANPALVENYGLTALSYLPVFLLLIYELRIYLFKKDGAAVGEV